MNLGTLLVIVGVVLAVISLFVAGPPLLAAAVILVGVGVLVGAPALTR